MSRSLKKGPFCDDHLMKKVEALNANNKKEVIKIQDEFFEIYKKNDLEQLRSFARQLDIIAEGYRAQSL